MRNEGTDMVNKTKVAAHYWRHGILPGPAFIPRPIPRVLPHIFWMGLTFSAGFVFCLFLDFVLSEIVARHARRRAEAERMARGPNPGDRG